MSAQNNDELANEREAERKKAQESSVRLERARWRSRRGLLELELLLAPFVEGAFSELEENLKVDYESLLEHDDMDIHEWLLARRPVPEEVQPVIITIRAFLDIH